MFIMWVIILIVALIASSPLLLLLYSFSRADKLPPSNPSSYLKRKKSGLPTKPIALFAGDSLTHGHIGVGYVDLLREMVKDVEYDFVNAGINGDLSWNLLQRLDMIISCEPSVLFLLIGSNDAMSNLPIRNVRFAQKRKRLPQTPTDDWFRGNMTELLDRLTRETDARIVLLSIPPLGEDVESESNSVARQYAQCIKELATQRGLDYLPVNERMNDYLMEHPSHPTYPIEISLNQMMLAMVKHFVFRKDWDAISRDAGQVLHVDHIHLNTTGAKIIADIIFNFLSTPTT